jgi:hypothetical protein
LGRVQQRDFDIWRGYSRENLIFGEDTAERISYLWRVQQRAFDIWRWYSRENLIFGESASERI